MIHYNKAHNQDQTIPQWVAKCRGTTYYVNHFVVDKGVGFSSKETPDNPHTKGALVFRKVNLTLVTDEDNLVVANVSA